MDEIATENIMIIKRIMIIMTFRQKPPWCGRIAYQIRNHRETMSDQTKN